MRLQNVWKVTDCGTSQREGRVGDGDWSPKQCLNIAVQQVISCALLPKENSYNHASAEPLMVLMVSKSMIPQAGHVQATSKHQNHK